MGEMIETARGAFYVDVTGPADPADTLVLVAGLGDDHASWADPVDHLAPTFRCVTFDNRGIGRSPITAGPYTTRQLAEDAHELTAALGFDRITVVGSSMGGAIGQEWALAYPDQVAGLVLSNSWGRRDPWFSALIGHWIELAGRGQGRDLLYQLALFCFSPDHMATNPSTVADFLDAPLPNLDGLRAAGRACQNHHAIDRLADCQTPTLVIGGEQDILTRPELSRELADALPNADLAWLPTGHMTFWEQPAEWASLVAQFVRSTTQ
jgi:3-oxoadipate enol-lactonase